jgi:hypothetical protein
MGTTENIVIETYDLGLKRWICSESESLLHVANIDTLLYRARGVTEGKGMSDEEDRVSNHGKPRKRPADVPLFTTARSVRSRLDSDTARKSTEPHTAPSPSHTLPLASSSAASMVKLTKSDTKRQSTAPRAKAPSHPWDRLVDPALVHEQSDAESSDSDSDLQIVSVNGQPEAATKKSAWPFKFVEAMAKGFDAMDSMSGTISQRFRAAFGVEWKKTSWNKHVKFWKHATEDERSRYIKAGCSQGGHWRAFHKEVSYRVAAEAREILEHAKIAHKEEEIDPMPLDDDEKLPDLQCFYCEETLPIAPSKTLLDLERDLDAVTKARNKESWKVVSALAEYCARHRAEASLDSQPPDCKWPAQIAELGRRVEALSAKLQVIWSHPHNNSFYKSVMLQVGRVGAEKTFDRKGDFEAAEIATVG